MTTHRKNRIGQLHSVGMSPDQFVEFASPIAWHRSSQHLHRAANVIATQVSSDWKLLVDTSGGPNPLAGPDEPYLDLFQQFFLLAAFALENVLKGIIVGSAPYLVKDGKLHGILTSHDLVALSSRAKIALTPEELRFCELASSASVAWGRYPVSVTAHRHVTSMSLGGSSFAAFNYLYSRLSSKFFAHVDAAKGGA